MSAKTDLIQKLREGNARHVEGRTIHDAARRVADGGPAPWCVVLTCSDSRVIPEFVFDTGPGELFVIRTAGQSIDEMVLGSIEYGAATLNLPMLLVLGHENCRAVAATCESKGEGGEGYVRAIVQAMAPVARKVGFEPHAAEEENVRAAMAHLREESAVIARLMDEKKLGMVGAIYSPFTYQVRFLSQSPEDI
jgi:carbonic anhydrase